MSVKSFKFVSPGIFVNEVDNSQLPRLPDATGPVIIGRAERGPGMVPVKVNSFAEFVEIFGEPVSGSDASDAWRNGNRMGPTYAAFAAQAYLKSASPVTFVRLLGEAHPDADADNKAGWQMNNAYALMVGKDNTNHVGAIIYTTATITGITESISGSDITLELVGAGSVNAPAVAASKTVNFSGAVATLITQAVANKLVLKDKTDATISVDFDATSLSNSIAGGVLTVGLGGVTAMSTAVQKIAAAINAVEGAIKITASASGTTLTLVNDEAGVATTPTDSPTTAAQANSEIDNAVVLNAGVNAANTASKKFVVNFDRSSKKYIRNVLNTNPTLTNTNLTDTAEAYFLGATFDQSLGHALAGDDINQAAIVDLTNIAPANSTHRNDASAPESPWVLSQMMGDPQGAVTPGLLTKLFKLHSLYTGEWEQKNFKISIADIAPPRNDFTKYGTFSVLIRSASDSDAAPQIVERFSGLTLDPSSPSFIGVQIGDMKRNWIESERRYVEIGQYQNQSRYVRVELASDVESGAAPAELLPFAFQAPLHSTQGGNVMPTFQMREETSSSKRLSSPKDAFFGIKTDKYGSEIHDPSYGDIVRRIKSDETGADSGELFSLDFITSTALIQTELAHVAGKDVTLGEASSLDDGTSINGKDWADYTTVLEAGFDKFTMPLFGGCDGLDITQIEPFNDTLTTSQSGYPFNSVKKAIDIVADPEVVECNMMTMPGIATPGLTGHLVTTCESRADALAIIDLQSDYTPSGWGKEPESDRLPDPSTAAQTLKNRSMNSSYGCAFFPWVQIRDNLSNKLVWVPPSVAAIGTMASSEANSELWFAPAGFTRGGLTNGAAGLPVVQTRYRLTSKERDKLYEANINPIAQFPAEGIVIFGQKTLQVTPSALDRINVRRLMIYVKKEISRMAATLLFDQNVDATWSRFTSRAEPFLSSVKSRFGLTEYRIILDETTTTPELIDRNIMYAKIYLKPARAIEFIAIDFVITNTGASFED